MKNNLKILFILLIILTIIINIIMSILTLKQYVDIKKEINIVVSNILEMIQDKYPDVDSADIIKILSDSNQNNNRGKEELQRYGIDFENISCILSIERNMKNNITTNCLVVTILGILYMIVFIIYIRRRDKKLKEITKYINEINNKNYELKIDENTEDDLTHLRNDLYKITILLKEEAERSKYDKEKLKMSLEDISHQLKTPLTSISIMLDNLKENPQMDESTRKQFIYKIDRQIEDINFLVISLLKLSRLDTGTVNFQKDVINVNNIIEDSIKKLEIPLEIKRQQIIKTGKQDVKFIGDYNWQLEAITNIIKNCIEHTKDNKNIYINFEENNLYTKIHIKDEGEGIPKKDLIHIFERFYKGTNSSDNSFGIGLALSKSIIEKDNGYISCKSEINVGTEFIIKYMK